MRLKTGQVLTLLLGIFCTHFCFIACKSTSVCVKETAALYDNNELTDYTETLTCDDKPLKTADISPAIQKRIQLAKESAPVPAGGTAITQIKLGDTLLETDTVPYPKDSSYAFMVVKTEQVQVDSRLNKKYLAYSFLGKPFVVLGASTCSLVKCTGFALWNFVNAATFGLYATIKNDSKDISEFFTLPNFNKNKERLAEARRKNAIEYPEFHKAFTDSHLTVTTTQSEITNVFSDDQKQVRVIAKDTASYDNTLSVKNTVITDVYATTAVVDYIGTAITIPIAVASYPIGFVFGLGIVLPVTLMVGVAVAAVVGPVAAVVDAATDE